MSVLQNYKVLSCCLVFFLACRSSQPHETKSEQDSPYKHIALERFKDSPEFVWNKGETHVLCLHKFKATNEQPLDRVSFFVFDIATNKIILEEKALAGTVTWENDAQIRVSLIPGIVRGDHSADALNATYLFNVHTHQRTFVGTDQGRPDK